MGRNLRSARRNLRDSRLILTDLVAAIEGELIIQSNVMGENLHNRVDSLYDLLIDTAEIKDAIVAGSTELMKDLERILRLQSKKTDITQFEKDIQVISDSLQESKLLYSRTESLLSKSFHESDDCVTLIERFTSDLRKLAASWEAQARELDELLSDVVDFSLPVEINEIEEKLSGIVYPIIKSSSELNQEEE